MGGKEVRRHFRQKEDGPGLLGKGTLGEIRHQLAAQTFSAHSLAHHHRAQYDIATAALQAARRHHFTGSVAPRPKGLIGAAEVVHRQTGGLKHVHEFGICRLNHFKIHV